MKKAFIALCIAAAGISAANAQEGQMAAGINLGVAPCLEGDGAPTNFGLGAKFQYNITDPIRVEADLEYWFKAKSISVFDISANIHYLFDITEYLEALEDASDSSNASRFLFNIGVGADYDITDNLTANFEIKYQYLKDFNRMPISIGIAYKF